MVSGYFWNVRLSHVNQHSKQSKLSHLGTPGTFKSSRPQSLPVLNHQIVKRESLDSTNFSPFSPLHCLRYYKKTTFTMSTNNKHIMLNYI